MAPDEAACARNDDQIVPLHPAPLASRLLTPLKIVVDVPQFRYPRLSSAGRPPVCRRGAILRANTVNESRLLDLLTCPRCRDHDLLVPEPGAEALRCGRCANAYPIADGIAIMVAPELAGQSSAPGGDRDDLAFKRLQAHFTDHEVDPGWEIRRPHGAPRLYGWLLEEKFRRSVAALPPLSPVPTVLTVCGGSGLDAEFLARRGAHVVSADISLEAAKRARERARRFGLDITPIVADAEALPFPDRSFDLAYVHDGLHHLEDPYLGLAELARVAAHAVSVNEPARASVTAIAVRVGLAAEQEEAGNRVARLELDEVAAALERLGFRTVQAERFAMYYKHDPGRVAALLSHRGTFPVAKAAVQFLNRLLGGLGNKLTVQAVRRGDGRAPDDG